MKIIIDRDKIIQIDQFEYIYRDNSNTYKIVICDDEYCKKYYELYLMYEDEEGEIELYIADEVKRDNEFIYFENEK